MRTPAVILAAALMAGAPCLALGQDTQSTTVRYAVSATITYVADDIQIVQKAPVGSLLLEPTVGGREGYVFLGWVNQETGELWDFATPVPGDLTLVASYRLIEPPTSSSSSADAAASSQGREGQMAKTGDDTASALLPAALAASALVGSAALAVALRRKQES